MIGKSSDVPWLASGYSTKRHSISITECDAEPVHTPGCVQAHGALLVLSKRDLTIVQASENCGEILGAPADRLLRRPVAVVLGPTVAKSLQDFLASELTDCNPLFLCTINSMLNDVPLDVTVHSVNGVVILEFEGTARDMTNNGARDHEYYSLVRKSIARIERAKNLGEFCDTTAREVRTLIGFDRVMVYKFHEDFHGEVVAEDKRDNLGSWLGLHYPADDIPLPARNIFSKVWVRPVPDINGELSELVPLLNPDTGAALEMTYCALRGPSRMYTEYLQNMGVTACLTMPVRSGTKLWGLIACHHYTGTRVVSHQLRSACELLAQVVSLQQGAMHAREHLEYRIDISAKHQRLVGRLTQEGSGSAQRDNLATLLDGISADGAALYYQGQWNLTGNTPNQSELAKLTEWLFARAEFQSSDAPFFATDALSVSYNPALDWSNATCGLMAVPISSSRRELLMWFRRETIHTVNWAGNPDDKPLVMGAHGLRLTPRHSFELFRESVRMRSLPWLDVEREAAAGLRSQFLEVVVSRAEELMSINTKLARANEELDAFAYVASHDLKEPLRGIHQYAGQLLAEQQDMATPQRDKVDGMVRLTLRMDRLLDALMDYARAGRGSLDFEPVDLNEVLQDAQEILSARLSPRAAKMVVPRPLPSAICDASSVGEIFVNLLSNALKYTDRPSARVEVGYVGATESAKRHGFPAATHQQTVYFVTDDGIGIAAHQFEQVFKMFKRLHGRDEYGGGSGAGLSIVKKMVERHQGVVWIDSTPQVGTTFYFTLSDDNS